MMNQYSWFKQIYNMGFYEINRRFPLVAAGSSRWVYAISDNYVIKVAVNKDGYDQCRRENRVYSNVDDYLREYLCPVVWYAPGMVVMVRAVPMIPLDKVVGDAHVNPEITGRGDRAYKDFKYLSRKFNLLYEDLLSVTSWGYIGDKPVLVDYGCKS